MSIDIHGKSWCCAECAVTDARQTGYERGVHDGDAAAYARGKADGMAEATSKAVAFIRAIKNTSVMPFAALREAADALERGEHKK